MSRDERDWIREERGRGYADRGDPTQRCAWCGAPTTYMQRSFVGGAFRRNYCSFSCESRGDIYPNTAGAICWSLLGVGMLIWVSGFPLVTLEGITVIGLFFAIPALCMWSCVYMGYSGRRRERELKSRRERW